VCDAKGVLALASQSRVERADAARFVTNGRPTQYYEFDKLPLPAAMAPPSDLLQGGLYVFAATGLFQIFAVVLEQTMGSSHLAGVVTSGAFCAMMASGCGESCAGMNPAAPVASQVSIHTSATLFTQPCPTSSTQYHRINPLVS
jgi:hypothetical protein